MKTPYQNNLYNYTFFNFATGPFKVKSNLQISLSEEDKNSKKIPIKMERLTNKNIFLSTFYKSCKK